MLRYFNPFAFHCYYASKETYTNVYEYSTLNSFMDIFNNLIYKTGLLFDHIRVINKIVQNKMFDQKNTYVMALSAGSLINTVFTNES